MGAKSKSMLCHRPLGAWQVATWKSNKGWQVAPISPLRNGGRLVTAAEYVTRLPNRAQGKAVDGFLACDSTMAVFELRRSGVRKALGVKVIPYCVAPLFYAEVLTTDTKPIEFNEAFPMLAQARSASRYHWDTPLFHELCSEMGLDPDEQRPRYHPAYAKVAGELEHWLGGVFTNGAAWDSPSGEAKNAVYDLLDLMRADQSCNGVMLDRLRQRWVRVDPGQIPRFDMLDKLVNSDNLLELVNLAQGTAKSRPLPTVELTLLPSRHGSSCSAIISGYWGRHAPDGWPSNDYADLRGIAIEPGREVLWEKIWLCTVMQQLSGQGVLFLSTAEAQAYLASDEAVYWAWRRGRVVRRPNVRRPTSLERLRWQLWPPRQPLDQELSNRRNKEPDKPGQE